MRPLSRIAVALILFATSAHAEGPTPVPAGQIVSWFYFPAQSQNFTWNQYVWTPTNLVAKTNKLYANTIYRCDVMFDALTVTNGAVFAALAVDGTRRFSQAVAGAPVQPGGIKGVITFGFSNVVGGLAAGSHTFSMQVAVQDGSSVTFLSTEVGIQCYETLLPNVTLTGQFAH